jgi:hypothetical protein
MDEESMPDQSLVCHHSPGWGDCDAVIAAAWQRLSVELWWVYAARHYITSRAIPRQLRRRPAEPGRLVRGPSA